MFERSSRRAGIVVDRAHEAARRLNHHNIGTEHILLGLLDSGEGLGLRLLRSLKIEPELIRQQVLRIIGEGQTTPHGPIPYTPRAKKVLELSLREALQNGNNYIGTEHMLLGLIREGEGVAAKVLIFFGAELKEVRKKLAVVQASYSDDDYPEESSSDYDKSRSRSLEIFLCHSSGDKDQVRTLHKRLQFDGFSCWLDEENLLPGQDWDFEIRKALRDCRYVLTCLSRSSIAKSGYVQKELRRALDLADEQPDGSIYLIPVRLEPCEIPDGLRQLQWVDLFDPDGYGRLLRALHSS